MNTEQELRLLPYPGIAAACLAIALDNGGINRTRGAKKWRADYRRWIAKRDGNLAEIDAWLAALSHDALEMVCAGGQDEPETIAAKADAPPFMDDLLNDYFDEVC